MFHKKKTDIQTILKYGKKISTLYGTFFLQDQGKNTAKNYAVLVKKSVGNAVKRNYCKRIVKAYLRSNLKLFDKFQSIVFLYNYSGSVKYPDMKDEFDKKITYQVL